MTTDQYERDFEEAGSHRFPGRFDPRLLSNKNDAGDGNPGLQKQIRNWVQYWVKYYLHNGHVEQDIDLTNFDLKNVKSIDGDGNAVVFSDDIQMSSSDIDMGNGNLDDIASIDGGGNAIDVDDNLNITGNITISGTVDTIDIANHNHDGSAGNGVTVPGQLIAWKQDTESAIAISSASPTATAASVTITLSENASVLVLCSGYTEPISGYVVELKMHDGSDMTQLIKTGVADTAEKIPFTISEFKNYSAGSVTWTLYADRTGSGTAYASNVVLTIIAFKQITSS